MGRHILASSLGCSTKKKQTVILLSHCYMNKFTASVLIQLYILSFMVQVKRKIVLLLRGRVLDEGD
jgi:hypothetical protein